jgi:glycosyltransferase involved in cell wall biosynthesis
MDMNSQSFQINNVTRLENNANKYDKKHILFVGPINDAGGIGSVIKLYKSYFNKAKYISTYPINTKGNKLKEFIRALFDMLNILKTDKTIKILHIHCASNGSFYRKSIVLIIGKLKKMKIIMHMHGGGFKDFYAKNNLNKIYIKSILGLSDKVICLSEEWHQFYSYELNLKNTIILGNAIEISEPFIKKKINGQIRILFMGKICNEKGIFDLIKFLSTNSNFLMGKIKLVICGVDEGNKINDLTSNKSWQKHIEHIGWVEGERKNKLIKESDIFILPSHFEGVPISILEAMAFGKPIIATNIGGIPSLVKNEINGWLIEPKKLDKLEEIFDDILEDPSILYKLGRSSYLAAKEYDPVKMFNRLEKIYEELINN